VARAQVKQPAQRRDGPGGNDARSNRAKILNPSVVDLDRRIRSQGRLAQENAFARIGLHQMNPGAGANSDHKARKARTRAYVQPRRVARRHTN